MLKQKAFIAITTILLLTTSLPTFSVVGIRGACYVKIFYREVSYWGSSRTIERFNDVMCISDILSTHCHNHANNLNNQSQRAMVLSWVPEKPCKEPSYGDDINSI